MSHYAKLVAIKAKAPSEHEAFKRPTVEYTGHGDLLCYDSYCGRYFRASEEWVRQGLDRINEDLKNEEYPNLEVLHTYWNIECSEFDFKWGWCPNDEYFEELKILYELELLTDPTKSPIVAKMKEPVLWITLVTEPIDYYMEI